MARRAPGTGSLIVRRDNAGRETWYGKWGTNGRQVKRRIGLKRLPATRHGLTRTQAEAELRRLMQEASTAPAIGQRLTLTDAGERYKHRLEATGRKKATRVAADLALRVHLVPFFGERQLDRIKPEDVDDLMRLLRSRGCSPKTIRNYVGTLSALFNYAEQKGWASGNPCRYVELPAHERSDDIRFLDPDEVELLLAGIPDDEFGPLDRALYVTAAMTGLRKGELIALRWRDIDWTAGRVRVRRNYVLGEFGTPKSRRSSRSVPMADRVAGELERLFQHSRLQGDDDLVFGHPLSGEPLEQTATLRRFRAALKRSKLDVSHRFHDLRHTFGTRMAAAGVAMRTLQEWMGHRDIQTTMIYADYAPSAREAELVESAFDRGTSEGTSVREPEGTSETLNVPATA